MRVIIIADEWEPLVVIMNLVPDLERISILQVSPDIPVVEDEVNLAVINFRFNFILNSQSHGEQMLVISGTLLKFHLLSLCLEEVHGFRFTSPVIFRLTVLDIDTVLQIFLEVPTERILLTN